MPLYHFQVLDDQTLPDSVGVQLPDLKAARVEAVRVAAEILKEHAETFWSTYEWQLKVTDDTGLTLFTLLFLAQEAPSTRRDGGRNS
ncbi:DUF6894 family protein [Muricoccus radiodurans]|uniref:DUF6894 family protein n=1 Tax=Muricoccus radiodurans TaxID=2231721 RepID=UPI003CF58283